MMIASRFKLLWLIPFVLMGAVASAQYQVFQWDNFEEGRMPSTLRFGYNASTSNVQVIPWAQAPNLPNLKGGVATTENMAFGLRFTPNPDQRHLSIMNSQMNLDRRRLGASGRALYQADFYLPPAGAQGVPTMSLLAGIYDERGTSLYRFYRFGVLDNQRVFFSYTDGGSEPEIYEQQSLSELENVVRPGWNRFQIIFLGQNEIYCAINGEFTSFSPMRQPTLTNLNAGVMVTQHTTSTVPASAYVDNLSIQWTPHEAPLPQSPWLSGPVTIAGQSQPQGTRNRNPQLFASDSVANWTGDPSAAWRFAQSQRKPVLALFHIPDIPPTRYLIDISPDDEEARRLLDQYVLLRIDINQLGGGQVAERFNIFRVPTMVVVGPGGSETTRLTVIPNQTSWDDIATMLRNGASGG